MSYVLFLSIGSQKSGGEPEQPRMQLIDDLSN